MENIQQTENEESEGERVFRLPSDLRVQFPETWDWFMRNVIICVSIMPSEKGFTKQWKVNWRKFFSWNEIGYKGE